MNCLTIYKALSLNFLVTFSCSALVMFCRIPTICHQLTSEHLDQILKDGDYLYRATSQKLRLASELHKDSHLECSRLLTVCLLLDGSSYAIDYEPLRYCKLEQDDTNDLESNDIELQAAFSVSNSNILIFGSCMMAIYRNSSTRCNIFFDSHSRNEFGFLTESGNSVALVFENMETLHTYLKVLCRQLNITTHVFSIHINRTSELSPILSTNTSRNLCHNNMENKPGYLAWTSDHFNNIDTVNRPLERNSTNSQCLSAQKSSNLSKSKRYQRLSITQKNEILEKKRKRAQDQNEYQIMHIGKDYDRSNHTKILKRRKENVIKHVNNLSNHIEILKKQKENVIKHVNNLSNHIGILKRQKTNKQTNKRKQNNNVIKHVNNLSNHIGILKRQKENVNNLSNHILNRQKENVHNPSNHIDILKKREKSHANRYRKSRTLILLLLIARNLLRKTNNLRMNNNNNNK